MQNVVITGRAINSQGPFNGAMRSSEGVLGAIGAVLILILVAFTMLFWLFDVIKIIMNEGKFEAIKGVLVAVSSLVVIIGGYWVVRYLIRIVAEAFGFISEPPL